MMRRLSWFSAATAAVASALGLSQGRSVVVAGGESLSSKRWYRPRAAPAAKGNRRAPFARAVIGTHYLVQPEGWKKVSPPSAHRAKAFRG